MDGTSWRSPLLGEQRSIELTGGELEYYVRGAGPPLLFAHGWLANANLWRQVVDRLSRRFRCITLDLPLGAHRQPMRADADLRPSAVAALIAELAEALDLTGLTLVGNDSGGAYAQIALTEHSSRLGSRVARLVLTSCETPDDEWPPPPFESLPDLARDPEALGQLFEALRDPDVRMSPPAYGRLVRTPPERKVFDSYVLPAAVDADVRRDIATVMAATTTASLRAASRALCDRADLAVLLVWSTEDTVFPIAHARRYADLLPNARLEAITGSFSFTPEDRPDALADAIRRFADHPDPTTR